MERVGQILRALFRRALSEHGQEAPALTDIIIDRARGSFEPRLGAQFANGYLTWSDLRPADCYAFCAQHAAWDLESLHRALLRDGQQIYSRMRADHLFELSRARVRREQLGADGARATLLERLRREADILDRDFEWHERDAFREPAPTEPEAPTRRQETQRRLMAWWTQQRSQLAGSVFFLRGSSNDGGSKKAQDRGLELLRRNLTPVQRQQYDRHGYFDIVGGKTGKRYRIRHGRSMNIEQLDKNGRRVCGWCFFPQGSLVAGDVMLGQKVALELYEHEALRIANRF